MDHTLAPVLVLACPFVAACLLLLFERKAPKVAAWTATAGIGLAFVVAAALIVPALWGKAPHEVAASYADVAKVERAEYDLWGSLQRAPTPDETAAKLSADDLRRSLGREPTPEEAAAKPSWTTERVADAESRRPATVLTTGETAWRVGFHIDHLAAAMLLMVTLASTLIHVFSIGYMAGETRYGGFFRWIGFFTFAMLGLVVSDNLLTLYICWELMGLSSYKLIGFFYQKESAYEAAKKAFMTTRVGDVGMFLGIVLLYAQTGTFRYTEIFDRIADGSLPQNVALLASIGLFFGAVGKSAQFPLHVWLPDAMEGPTPVSALIHAATMVAAGVYLVARMYPLFEVHPAMLPAVAVVGTFTALFAGTIAVCATDIKKVLAYSTVSQLGFMFAGLGAGGIAGYYGGTFHLVNHAFFKACLFLGSGSVIHAVHTQEVGQMGGLWRKLPVTFVTWMVATAAIAGFPFTSGFFSKDAILLALATSDPANPFAMVRLACMFALVAGAFLTAAYMMRVTALTFFGVPRDRERFDHAHESPVMTLPLVVLAAMALASGYAWHENFLRPETVHGMGYWPAREGEYVATEVRERWDHWHHLMMFIAIPAGLGGLALGGAFYMTPVGAALRAKLRGPLEPVFRVWRNKYWIDEAYERTAVAGTVAFSKCMAWFDREVVDGLVNLAGRLGLRLGDASGWTDREVVDRQFVHGAAGLADGAGALFSKMQGGKVRVYLYQAVLTTAVLALVIAAVYR